MRNPRRAGARKTGALFTVAVKLALASMSGELRLSVLDSAEAGPPDETQSTEEVA